MELAVDRIGDVAVVTPQLEELDAANSGELKRSMAAILEVHAKVVLNLRGLRFIDSSGLGALLSCLRKLSVRGGDLKLCNLAQQVRITFELVRLHRIFDIHASREEAVHSFGERAP